MDKNIIEDQIFQKTDFSQYLLIKGNYENCSFDDCIFSNLDLSDFNFIECKFNNCDLSLVKIINTAFRDTTFIGCKLLGLHFDTCNKFGQSISFESCHLKLSSFCKLNLKSSKFIECNLQEVDFTESNLTGVIFDGCDLTGAVFVKSNLEKSDFRTSFNFSIDPEINRIKKAKFSMTGIVGLLDKYDIVIDI